MDRPNLAYTAGGVFKGGAFGEADHTMLGRVIDGAAGDAEFVIHQESYACRVHMKSGTLLSIAEMLNTDLVLWDRKLFTAKCAKKRRGDRGETRRASRRGIRFRRLEP